MTKPQPFTLHQTVRSQSQPRHKSNKPNTKATQYGRKHFIVGKKLPNGVTVTNHRKHPNGTQYWQTNDGNVWYALPKWTVAKKV